MKAIAALLCLSLFGMSYAQNPAFCSATLSTAENEASDGNFESQDTWSLDNAAYAPTSESDGCDSYSLKVDSSIGSSSVSQNFSFTRDIISPFYFSAWFKGDSVAFGDSDSASFVLDVDGFICALTIPSGSFDWTPAGILCNAGTNPSNVIISGSFSSTFSGVLYVDNVYLCYFGTEGCVYDVFNGGYLYNGWSAVTTRGDALIQASEFAGEPAYQISSTSTAIVQEIRFTADAVNNFWSQLVFWVVNPTNPVFASLGPLEHKTFVVPHSSWANVTVSLSAESQISTIVLSSVPTNYYITGVGLQ